MRPCLHVFCIPIRPIARPAARAKNAEEDHLAKWRQGTLRGPVSFHAPPRLVLSNESSGFGANDAARYDAGQPMAVGAESLCSAFLIHETFSWSSR